MPNQTLLTSQLGKTLKVWWKHPEQMSRDLNITTKVNSHADRAGVSGVPRSGTGQAADFCRELECSKSGERLWFWAVCSTGRKCRLMKGSRWELDCGSRSGFGQEDTLGKTQGKCDIIHKVLELVPSAGTRAESALKELRA